MNNHSLQVLLPARRERGFTLIELMITAAIIAILAAIAIPSYQDSIWKGKRAEGKAALLKMLQAQERYYSNKNSYVQPTGLTANERAAFPAFSADTLANSRYTLTVTTATTYAGLCSDNDLAKCVIAVATVNGPADPKCGNYLAMDSLGNKTSAVTNAICWK